MKVDMRKRVRLHASAAIDTLLAMMSRTFELEISLRPILEIIDEYSLSLPVATPAARLGNVEVAGSADAFDIRTERTPGMPLPLQSGDKYGYVDRSGAWVIEPQFGFSFDFYEGLASVSTASGAGFIDPFGKFVIEPRFETADSFSEGLAAVMLQGKNGYIDKTGTFIISLKPYYRTRWFRDGMAAVETEDPNGQQGDSWTGYIDKTGKLVVPVHYDYGDDFSEGLAAVCMAHKCGYIDRTGKVVISLAYDWTSSFSEGLAQGCSVLLYADR